jgi:hypothetical protein
MTVYHIEIINENNNIYIHNLFGILPKEIEIFIYEKIQNKIVYLDKTIMLGNQFKINWTYYFNDDIIHIRYKLYHCKIKIKKDITCNICMFC